jgi:glycopeptide antibiotics resistance protein
MCLFYFAALISVTLFPVYIDQRPIESMRINGNILLINLIPFKSIIGSLTHSYYMVGIRNVLGNILLFVPFGIILGILMVQRVHIALLAGLALSFGIELLQLLETQLFLGTRAVDIDDLFLNSLGTVVGFVIYKTIKTIMEKVRARVVSNSKKALDIR